MTATVKPRSPDERARRVRLIEAADFCCQRCGRLAWTAALLRDLVLRPKEAVGGNTPGDDYVFCAKCALKHDEKKQRRRAG
jgi:hypothetical protein